MPLFWVIYWISVVLLLTVFTESVTVTVENMHGECNSSWFLKLCVCCTPVLNAVVLLTLFFFFLKEALEEYNDDEWD